MDSQDSPGSPALARLLPAIGGGAVVDRLAGLSGSDFTSVMLEVMRRRAARETPAACCGGTGGTGSSGPAACRGGRCGGPRMCWPGRCRRS